MQKGLNLIPASHPASSHSVDFGGSEIRPEATGYGVVSSSGEHTGLHCLHSAFCLCNAVHADGSAFDSSGSGRQPASLPALPAASWDSGDHRLSRYTTPAGLLCRVRPGGRQGQHPRQALPRQRQRVRSGGGGWDGKCCLACTTRCTSSPPSALCTKQPSAAVCSPARRNVAQFCALKLVESGAVVLAMSDSHGTVGS